VTEGSWDEIHPWRDEIPLWPVVLHTAIVTYSHWYTLTAVPRSS